MKHIIRKSIANFPFWDYGLDNVDPASEYAEWVDDLAEKIHRDLVEALIADVPRGAAE